MTQAIPGQRVREAAAALTLRYGDVLREELEAHKKARESSGTYVKKAALVDAYCDRMGLSAFQRWQKKDGDWELTQAFNGWHFWQREALRCAAEREAIKERIKMLAGQVMM